MLALHHCDEISQRNKIKEGKIRLGEVEHHGWGHVAKHPCSHLGR